MPLNKTQTSWVNHAGQMMVSLADEFTSMTEFLGEMVIAIKEAVLAPRKIRWRETFYYMNICGVDGLPITALICFLMGIILGYQSAVQMHKYGADAFLPALVGCSIVRELGPLMVAIVATGRSGSAFAAEIGTMKISEELDAMRTMGFSLFRFLVIPKFIAMLTMIPLLCVIGDVLGIIGGFLVGNAELNMSFETYFQVTRLWVLPKYFIEGLIKSFIFAIIVTVVGCWRGMRTGNDAIAVGNSTTSAVVISILFIILSDTALAKFFTYVFGVV